MLHPVADLRTIDAKTIPAVHAIVAGKIAALIVDTGAVDSTLTEKFIQAANLKPYVTNRTLVGLSGEEMRKSVSVPSVTIGYATAHDVQFGDARMRDIRLADGTVVDGNFGGDFLSSYDVLLDLNARTVKIYASEHCDTPDFKPFDKGWFSMPFALRGNEIILRASVDDRPMLFMLDSGASRTTLMTLQAVRIGGVSSSDPVVQVGTIGENTVPTRVHQFGSLSIGRERVGHPHLLVAPGFVNLLGDDFLRTNRVWISYPTHRIYVQPLPGEFTAGTTTTSAPGSP